VRGARIEPGDIDLVCSGDGALGLGAIFADAIIEPVVHDATSPVSDYWGRPREPLLISRAMSALLAKHRSRMTRHERAPLVFHAD
jgi:hypothetical protein